MKKLILFGLLLISLLWLGYVAFDIASNDSRLDVRTTFSSADSTLIVILRPEEVILENFVDLESNPNRSLFAILNPAGYEQAYISGKRKHCLLKKNTPWKKEDIESLFLDQNIKDFDGKTFTVSDYKAKVFKTRLYLFAQEYQYEGELDNLVYDKKASVSVCTINKDNSISSRTEIYFKPDGVVKYVSKNDQNLLGRKIDDASIFAKYISSDIQEYHFMEKEYSASVDSVFSNGPMMLWLENGFVEVKIKGQLALISDFQEGQDPDLVLSDFTQEFDTARFTTPLTKNFPEKGKSYTFKYLDGLVVFSTSDDLCSKILSDYHLGRTIALNNSLKNKLYNTLPKMVSERVMTKNDLFASSIYKNEIHQSFSRAAEEPKNDRIDVSSKPISLAFGEDIFDFWHDAKSKTTIITGNSGKIACYKGGKLNWEKKVTDKPVNKITAIDLFDSGKLYYFYNTKNQLHLFDDNGESPTGFPINLEAEASIQTSFYRWKGNGYFLVPSGTKLFQFDSKGREINAFNMKVNIEEPAIVWASQSKLFTGTSGEGKFVMYELEKRKIYRDFSLNAQHDRLKFPNEIFHYTISDGYLNKIDQKGLVTKLDKRDGQFVLSEHKLNRSLLIKDQMNLYLTNENGIPYGEVVLTISDLASMDISQTNNGLTILAILDGLENNVYLYKADGSKMTPKTFEGQGKVLLEAANKELILSTIVDQFVVLYTINY